MKRNFFKRIVSTCLAAAMILSGNVAIHAKNFDNSSVGRADCANQSKENYIIDCGNAVTYNRVCSIVNDAAVDDSVILEDNNVIAVQLPEDIKEEIIDLGVTVEYDECVEGAAHNNKTQQEHKDRDDWNMRSIEVIPEETDDSKEKIKIAVIDSGIDFNENINVVERKNFLGDEVSPLYEDNTGHGTAIAGIIASDGCDDTVKGINPNVMIYSARVLDDNSKAPISRIVEAIYWAIENDVKIINMSFGTKTYSKALHNAIQSAEKKGILMFAASGNEGGENSMVEYPAAFKEVVAVGAASKTGKVSEITSTGQELELVAPGEEIDSVGWLGMDVKCNGTSMAVPHAVGVASLLWQKDITKPAKFIRELLKASAKTIADEEGEEFSYIDFTYAEKIYDDMSRTYKNSGNNGKKTGKSYKKNKGKVKSYEGEVEARWSRPKHESTVEYADSSAGDLTSTQVAIVKLGARAPDDHCPSNVYPSHRMLHAMGPFNYVKVYEQIMNMSIRCKLYGHNSAMLMGYPDGNPGIYGECETARSWLGEPEIKVMLANKYPYTNKNASLIMMGVAMHVMGDTFAHKAGVYDANTNTWRPIGDMGMDNDDIYAPNDSKSRFLCAKESCAWVLASWSSNINPGIDDYDFEKMINLSRPKRFKLERFKTYCEAAPNGFSYSKATWQNVYAVSYAD
ncbi:MAG: S8 family serine peptidase [Lachnospiraceae bacterium]|nr:S8 family serine peptidase [Lachnospiraceae bacterium]